MKKEKKYSKDKEKYKSGQEKNHTQKLEMNLSYPIKINTKICKKALNHIESSSPKNKISNSPRQLNIKKDKIFVNNFIISEKSKNINKSLKNSVNLMENKKNSSSDTINNLNKNEKRKEMHNENIDIDENSLENNDFYNVKNNNNIQSSIINNKNSKNYKTPNNLNQIYTNEQYNNELFSNLFIDTSSDNKNILVSELDIELSNIEQSNCNKKDDKQNINIIEDEEETNQKTNEHISEYKKIELRFKSKLEKSLNKYFKKNGTNFYIGDSNNSNQFNKQIKNQNKSKSNKNVQNNIKENKKNIKKLINSDGKMLHNINFTIDLRENNNIKKMNNINCSKLKLIKNKLKENENVKKFKKIISLKTTKLKIKKNNNLMNKKNSSKKVNKENSTQNKITKQKKNSPKTKTIVGERKVKAIYSKIINDAKLINENKNKIIKEKDIYLNKYTNKKDKNAKNYSTGARPSFQNSPYFLHSINSIKEKKINCNTHNFNLNFNQLYPQKIKNNIFKKKINITSSYNNTKRKNFDEIHNKNNITYINSKSVKDKNKLNKLFHFCGNDDKEQKNSGTHRSKRKVKDFQHKRNELNNKAFKNNNYNIRGNPLKHYKGLKTEINNFKTIKYFNLNRGINKIFVLDNKKINNNDELIKNRNMKYKVKSDIYDDNNSENSVFFYDKTLFLCCSPNKNIKLLQHNSFKKKLASNL